MAQHTAHYVIHHVSHRVSSHVSSYVSPQASPGVAHHHVSFFVIAPIAFAAFYVVREFLQAKAGRWAELAERYANTMAPKGGWKRLPFLWLEWTSGRTLGRATYGRTRMTLGLWGQLWETVMPTMRVAATRQGLHLRHQPWHFKQRPLLIPWKAVSGFELIDGSEAQTSHGGTMHPAIGAAIQARLPGGVKAAMDSVGKVARLELKEPKMLLLLPADAIGDVTRYLGGLPSSASTPTAPAIEPTQARGAEAGKASVGPAQPSSIRPASATAAPVQPSPQAPPQLAKVEGGLRSVRTAKCRELGHPEFTLAYDPRVALDRDARWYAGVLEQMVQAGSRFKPGQTLQLGWSIARVVSLPDDTLGLEEYDLKGMPPKRQASISESLRVLRLQKDTLESVLPAKSLKFALLNQSCIVCTRLAGSKTFLMQRDEPDASQGKSDVSGWFLGCTNSEHDHNAVDNLKKVSLYEAMVLHCPAALPFLAFPPGSLIGMVDELTMFLNAQPLTVRKGSYLDMTQPKRAAALH